MQIYLKIIHNSTPISTFIDSNIRLINENDNKYNIISTI